METIINFTRNQKRLLKIAQIPATNFTILVENFPLGSFFFSFLGTALYSLSRTSFSGFSRGIPIVRTGPQVEHNNRRLSDSRCNRIRPAHAIP